MTRRQWCLIVAATIVGAVGCVSPASTPTAAGEAAVRLKAIMEDPGIRDYQVQVPHPPGAGGMNYGVWVEFQKPPVQNGSEARYPGHGG